MDKLIAEIEKYSPQCLQEERDKEIILRFAKNNSDCLFRTNETAHFTVSAWIVNRELTKVLFVYHKIYDSWSWVGGHADGNANLKEVALKEAREETGISVESVADEKILSLEILNVESHFRRGEYVPPHLHLNVTYLVVADESEVLCPDENETGGAKWFTPDAAIKASVEKVMIERVYKKLIAKTFG